MNWFTAVFIVALPAIALGLLLWGVWEAVRGPRTQQRPRRRLVVTYGPGYSLLQWKQEQVEWIE